MRSVPPVVILSADGIYYSQRAGRSGFADWGATAAASRILELGLRELNADAQAGFDGAADVLELLAGLPAPEEILKLRPSLLPIMRIGRGMNIWNTWSGWLRLPHI
jgi:hypothetical protein